MLIAIKAYEGIYGGLHGMYDIFIGEYSSKDEAIEDAISMSYQVMEDYLDELGEMEEEEIEENVEFDIYKIKDQYANDDIRELENKFFNSEDEFIATYCEEF